MNAPQQLYLFKVPAERAVHPEPLCIGALSLRPDHVLLSLMFGLIGLSVIFALGVERGRQVAQVQPPLLAPREPEVKAKASTPPVEAEIPSSRRDIAPSPAAPKPRVPKAPVKVATGGSSQCAIQVVTYSQPMLAQQELQRLHQRGERAFLMKRQGRTVLYVGPFPSKAHAATKLTSLRHQYRDCFVKSL